MLLQPWLLLVLRQPVRIMLVSSFELENPDAAIIQEGEVRHEPTREAIQNLEGTAQ